MRNISKLIGGIVGLIGGGLVAKGLIPQEAAAPIEQISNGNLTPETIVELIFVGLGVYFAPKNAN